MSGDKIRCFSVQHYCFHDNNDVSTMSSVTHLHGESLSIDGVLWSWFPIPSPVKVKLSSPVVTWQSSSGQSHWLWQSKVSCRQESEYINQPGLINIWHKIWEEEKSLITRVSFVFHCNVDFVGVTNEVEGWQGAVDVHFAGDYVNWGLP